MKRIDLFMPHQSRYHVLHHFTEQMYEALKRQGIHCRLLEADLKNPKPFIEALVKDPPDCTFTFNGFPPDSEGRFLSDIIEIPHVYHLVDSASHFFYLTQSARSIIACVDGGSVDYIKNHGFSNVFFLPHGTDAGIQTDAQAPREYDAVSLASCIDFEAIRKSWRNKYATPLRKAMEEAVEMALEDFLTPIDVILAKIKPEIEDEVSIIREIETVVRGKDRIELLKSIKDVKVDIFGFNKDANIWKKYLGKKKNIVIHDEVPFEEAIALMKKSKIILNSCSWIRYGAHERILTGLACGALVITDENDYLREHFREGESIAFYQPGHWGKVNQTIQDYLSDEANRSQVAEQGRKIVMKSHTWDQRAAQLIKELPRILAKI